MLSSPGGVRAMLDDLLARYDEVRRLTRSLCEPLTAEDMLVQSMPSASPTKWHLAHTTWFFEEFVLGPFLAGYRPADPRYRFLFNSYYEAVGPRHARPRRGLLTRPTIDEVVAYRRRIDDALSSLLAGDVPRPALELVELGIHHQQQHQ